MSEAETTSGSAPTVNGDGDVSRSDAVETPKGAPTAEQSNSAESGENEPAEREASGVVEPAAKSILPPVKKKETFQWSTPADEFAEDVGSDIEDVEDEDRAIEYESGDVSVQEHSYKKRSPKTKSKKLFPCPKCSKVWNWPWELRRHLLMHFKEKERLAASAYTCKECGKGFQWKRDLAQHLRLHTGEKLLVCSVCGKKFVTRQALLHHVVVHTGEKPFQCALCGNRFTQPANLRTHTKKKHDTGPIKGSKCPHCHESFGSVVAIHQHILDDHQNIVAEEREELALVKMRREQDKLEMERKKAENRQRREERRRERAAMSDYRDPSMPEWKVNYEFKMGEGIVRGVDWDRTPSNGELGCDDCEQKFGWRYEIMFHRLCHAVDEDGDPKNRVCPECDTVFKVPIGLKHHLLLHTGELPFLCLHCWRSFSSHIDLKLHIRREHLFHLDLPTPKAAKRKQLKEELLDGGARHRKVKKEEFVGGQVVQVGNIVNEAGESVQLIVQHQAGDGQVVIAEEHQQQTIVLGADGSIVNPNNQDMIVVIQSENYDQSRGVVVVDPSQLQQLVGDNGVPVMDGQTAMIVSGGGDVTCASHSEGTELIISDQNESAHYISLEVSEDGTQHQQHVILSTNADGQQTANIKGNNYIVVATEQADFSAVQGEVKQVVAEQAEEAAAAAGGKTGSIVIQEMMTNQDLNNGDEGQVIGVIQEPQEPSSDSKASIGEVEKKPAEIAAAAAGNGAEGPTDETIT